MKVLIIEDERPAAEKLQQMIKQIDQSIEILTILETVEESIEWLSSNEPPDLIFMDIQLDDGISFEIFETIEVEAPVIFTTAYDEYAVRAFKVNSIDYLLKPIGIDELKQAIRKFKKLQTLAKFLNNRLNSIYQELMRSYKTRFIVKVGLHFRSISVDEISCFFIHDRNTFLFTSSGKQYDLDYSLDQLQKMINPDVFFRISRSALVNIQFIRDILSYSTSRLLLKLQGQKEDLELVVSRDKVADFKRWLDK